MSTKATINESIRIKSPSTALLAKEVPPEGDTIYGRFIPGGTSIAVNQDGLLRQKSVFGPDVDLFRPERWLEADESTKRAMERNNDLAFGHGRWMCAGKSVAIMELNKVLVEVCGEYLPLCKDT
jgi:cytochrome P450